MASEDVARPVAAIAQRVPELSTRQLDLIAAALYQRPL